MRIQHPFARSLITVRTWPIVIDFGVALCGLAIFFGILHMARYWMGSPVAEVPISHSERSLPLYAFYSIVRITLAYLLSLIFAIAYGYTAAYSPRIEAWMVAVLDILQSIPVLSFLPPVVLAMVSLIPGHQLGIEMGVILLIFTGQVWNLAFSFYSSLKTIPREMVEASRIYRYSAWQRFWQLEMPYAAIGLVWNSIVSVAGGWFALMLCEMFTMGDRNFRLPGLGSYMQSAADSGDTSALFSGIAVVILIVVATDQLVWRPLIAWSDKFKFEQVESADRITSPILTLLQRSRLLTTLPGKLWSRIEEPIYRRIADVARIGRCAASGRRGGETQGRSGRLLGAGRGGRDRRRMGAGPGSGDAAYRDMGGTAPAAGGGRRDVSARQFGAADFSFVDDTGRGRHRLQSPPCAYRSTGGAGAGIGARLGILSGAVDWD